MAVEVLKQQLADLTRDYTGACESIRRLEANVAGLRGAMAADDARLRAAEERVWPGMTYDCDAPDWMADELLWTRAQLAAAEAARDAVAEQVRAHCAWVAECTHLPRSWPSGVPLSTGECDAAADAAHLIADAIRALLLRAPSAALQRVREEAQKDGAERALRWAADHPCGTGGLADLLGAVADDPRDQWAGYVKRGLAALFPTPSAGGPA